MKWRIFCKGKDCKQPEIFEYQTLKEAWKFTQDLLTITSFPKDSWSFIIEKI
jgi:hypothetical protein